MISQKALRLSGVDRVCVPACPRPRCPACYAVTCPLIASNTKAKQVCAGSVVRCPMCIVRLVETEMRGLTRGSGIWTPRWDTARYGSKRGGAPSPESREPLTAQAVSAVRPLVPTREANQPTTLVHLYLLDGMRSRVMQSICLCGRRECFSSKFGTVSDVGEL